MMNDRFDPTDESSELHSLDCDGQESRFEQQLRSVRPRAPLLNWDKIASGSIPLATQVAPSTRQTGFSIKQMTLAVVASWLLGAVVGGSCIFWSMPAPGDLQGNVQGNVEVSAATESSPPTPRADQTADQPSPTAVVNNSSSSVEDKPSFTGGTMPYVEFNSLTWLSDEPLSPRSLTSPKSARRLTALRTSSSTVSANISSEPSKAPAKNAFQPEPMSNRQQLMEQYIKETVQQVY